MNPMEDEAVEAMQMTGLPTPPCYGQEIPADFPACAGCELVAACWTAFESGRPDWRGEIPVDGAVLPAAESAYAWLVAGGVPDAEAWRRVWGEMPGAYVRPLVAQIRWQTPEGNAPRTGPGAFRPGDHVRYLAGKGKASYRIYSVVTVKDDGKLTLYRMASGYIRNADPRKWKRLLRNEELQCAA
jgi:hypothetical protein